VRLKTNVKGAKMTMHVISTFANRQQGQRTLAFVTSMNEFTPKEFIKNTYGEVEKDCVKISMWITHLKDNEVVAGWFLNCNGKFFFEDGKLR
jgi:hypothetical protein